MQQLDETRLQNLVTANAVRIERADDKKKIARMQLDPAAILREPPEHWRNAKIIDLLLCVPRVGRSRAALWLSLEHTSATRTISAMTERQRHSLASHLDIWMDRRLELVMDRAAKAA